MPATSDYLNLPLRPLDEVLAARDIADAAAEISEAATTLRRLATGLYDGYAEGHDNATLVRAAAHDLRQHVRTVTALIDELDEPAKGRVA